MLKIDKEISISLQELYAALLKYKCIVTDINPAPKRYEIVLSGPRPVHVFGDSQHFPNEISVIFLYNI